MFKLVLEKALEKALEKVLEKEPEIKLPTYAASSKKKKNNRVPETHLFLFY